MEDNEEILNITEEFETVKRELELYKDKYIRTYAELDNTRKRHSREISEIKERAAEDLIENLIPVFDHFDLAIMQADYNNSENAFIEGIKLIAAEFQKTLENAGAVIITTEPHDKFNPALHEALTTVNNKEFLPGTIVNQFRKGWKLGSKVIRPAQVIVAVE
jgi:molecular chaperone GrpE